MRTWHDPKMDVVASLEAAQNGDDILSSDGDFKGSGPVG